MDPAAVMEASKVAAEEFRRDYLVASVVVLLVSHAIVNFFWAKAFARMADRLSAAQEARVLDKKEDRAELAAHLDRATEAMTLVLAETRQRVQRRRQTDPGEIEALQVKKLREGA